ALRLGAEQGATTHLPALSVHERLMPLLDERWPAGGRRAGTRLVAHPGGKPIEQAIRGDEITLAIGPEGGWIQREVDTFVERGFTPVAIGPQILRVETAVAAALGQLVLLLRVRDR
ncbi:MAG TPA: RsmE family RNA methyltransferase, partial [Kofleriaceae bacterium]|nr:RsmE family RNA methyltransferase [Kofleriaceae bacterium]